MVNTENRNDTKFKIFFCTLRCVKNLLWFLVCLLSIEGLFVENLLSWILQALFVFLLLPFLSNLKGIPFAELPAYLNRGAACFLNIGGNLKGKYISYFLVVYLQMVNKHCLIFCNFKSVVIGGKKMFFFWNLWGVNNIHFLFAQCNCSVMHVTGIYLQHHAVHFKLKTL